jgi:hypothetical protein
VTRQRVLPLAGAGIEEIDRVIAAGRGDPFAIGAPGDAVDEAVMLLERMQELTVGDIPDFDAPG